MFYLHLCTRCVCLQEAEKKKNQILSVTGVSDGCKLQCGHWKLNQEKSCSLLTAEPPLQIVFSFKSPVSNKLLNICNRDKGPESGPRFTGGARQPGHHQAALLPWLLYHSGPPSCVHHHHLRSPAELVLDMTRKLQSSALILSETLCSFIPCPLVLVIKWAQMFQRF